MEAKWKDFGLRLKELRQGNNISRGELATKVNRKPSTVASWEQGYRRPKLQSILDISNYFELPIQPLQASAGYTPEFDWYVALAAQSDTEADILLNATDDEKEELRRYLLYLRFIAQLIST